MFTGGGRSASRKSSIEQLEVGDFIRLHQNPVRQRATTGAANLIPQQLDRAVEDSVIVWLKNAKSAVIEKADLRRSSMAVQINGLLQRQHP